ISIIAYRVMKGWSVIRQGVIGPTSFQFEKASPFRPRIARGQCDAIATGRYIYPRGWKITNLQAHRTRAPVTHKSGHWPNVPLLARTGHAGMAGMARMTRCRLGMCSATSYAVAQRLAHPAD